jgi:hypothetical protein
MQMNDDKAERMGASLEALNARIARLAMALEVALDDQAGLQALMTTPQVKAVAFERRDGAHATSVPPVHVTSERRTAHKREELRGLLVLRYHLETSSVNDNGLALTRQVLKEAEAHLVRQGFKPGADGLALDHLFNPL